MKETRICSSCNSKMLRDNHYEKGGVSYIYLKCPKCGARRKLLILEKIVENYRPNLPDTVKSNSLNPLPES